MNQPRKRNRITWVNTRALRMPWDLSAVECYDEALVRVAINSKETGHPSHHKTASGVIVDADPTLEYYLSRLSEQKRERIRIWCEAHTKADALSAVPVNRTYYGHDIYKEH